MALNLVSGMGLLDPRVDGYKTFAGAAMASFLKIRTEMNLAIWKMRLELANPADLIKQYGETEDRILKLQELKYKMSSEGREARNAHFEQLRKEAQELHKVNLGARVKLGEVAAESLNQLREESFGFDNTDIPPSAMSITSNKLKTMAADIREWVKMKSKNRVKPGSHTQEEFDDMRRNIINKYASAGAVQAGQTGESKDTIGGAEDVFTKAARTKAWHFYYHEPELLLRGMKKNTKSARVKADLDELRTFFTIGANVGRYGQGTTLDMMTEFAKDRMNAEGDIVTSRGIISDVMPALQSGGAVMTRKQMLEEATILTATPEQLNVEEAIYRSTRGLGGLSERISRRRDEQGQLLRFGGRNLATAPFSRYASPRGQTMLGMAQRAESQPHLRGAAGLTGERFPAGEGGNLTTFIKARIGRYVDAMDAGGGDRDSADFTGMSDAMNQVARSVDLYRGSLSSRDITFARPVSIPDIKDPGGEPKTTTSLLELVDVYNSLLGRVSDEQRDQFAAGMIDQIKAGDAPIAAEYLSMQRAGTEDEKRAAAYNERLYPLRTNISVVLQPKISAMITARESEDIEGFGAALQDIYKTVEDPKLDELYGSAGVYIREALQDTGTSSGQIGDINAAIGASYHIEDLNNDMMTQRSEADAEAQAIWKEMTDE